MSSYHSSFTYLNKNSQDDFGWIISHFDPDDGETDGYLSQDQVYTESYNGTKRNLYGTKYNTVATVKITVIKQDGKDFSLDDCRAAYRWLTGITSANWMDLYVGDEVKYRLLCTIQDVKPQKLDARTIGLNIYCESLSPWAYSPHIKIEQLITNTANIEINNESDDLYTYTYMKTTFKNKSGKSLQISNLSTEEVTQVNNLATNEFITLDGNQMITSDKPSRVFGTDFNFVFPRLKAGYNKLNVSGTGTLILEYAYPIKMGDCAQSINITRDPICDDSGNIQVDTLPWARISDTPNTLFGYGITDAYTKSEVDYKLENIDVIVVDSYTKAEIDQKFENIVASEISIDEDALNNMLIEILVS